MSQQSWPQSSNVAPGQPGPMDRCWLVNDQGRQFGPYTATELAGYVASGHISLVALVWREGIPQWVAISTVVQAPVYPQQFQNFPPPAGDNNKLAAGLCGILLGALGVHKFILGYNAAGVTMLLISVLTCGFGAPVMHVFGLIEGITYLTKSDAEFYQQYVLNKKPWF